MKLLSLIPTLCDRMDCSLPGFSVHGIFQARVLEWGAIAFSRGSSRPRDCTQVSCIAGRRFTLWATREANCYVIPTKMASHPWALGTSYYAGFPVLWVVPFMKIATPYWVPIVCQTWCSICSCCSVTKSYLIVCNPMDCNLPGSSVHGIFQARITGVWWQPKTS